MRDIYVFEVKTPQGANLSFSQYSHW